MVSNTSTVNPRSDGETCQLCTLSLTVIDLSRFQILCSSMAARFPVINPNCVSETLSVTNTRGKIRLVDRRKVVAMKYEPTMSERTENMHTMKISAAPMMEMLFLCFEDIAIFAPTQKIGCSRDVNA